MIDEILDGYLERFGPWILGPAFLVAAVVVAAGAPGSDSPGLRWFLAFVLLHTSAMLLVGFGLKRARRFLVVSWVVVLTAFLAVSVVVASA